VISAGGIVNAASFASPVAPGSLISVFGQNLASSTESASGISWPVTLGDSLVQVNGVNIPLYSVSPQQINAQLPFEAVPGIAAMSIRNSRGSTEPVAFTVAPASIGIFVSANTTRAIAQNQDGTLNSVMNPESRGKAIVLYLTGQGAVSPAVLTGQPAPKDGVSQAALPFNATIGSVAADVFFLGLTPGFIGLAQANLIIPAAAPVSDDVPVVINVGGQPSNSATISIR
jgi:uncharacterized protein (TIGR03437 family)